MFLIALFYYRVYRYGWKTTLKFLACDVIVILILMAIGQYEINKQNEEYEYEQFQQEMNERIYGDDY